MIEDLKKIEDNEADFIFSDINDEIIWNLGTYIVENIKKNRLKAGVQIVLNQKTVFQYLSNSCSLDNQNWLRRKINSVLYFQKSTNYLSAKTKGNNQLLEAKYGLSVKDYTIVKGGFPIVLKGVGTVGAIAVSGLLPEEDHKLVTDAILKIIK